MCSVPCGTAADDAVAGATGDAKMGEEPVDAALARGATVTKTAAAGSARHRSPRHRLQFNSLAWQILLATS
jgi:hypothetical protein